MKLSNIFLFSCAVWFCLSTSAYSQLPFTIQWEPAPRIVYTLDEIRDMWVSYHYDVYNEDVSSEPWARTVQTWLDYAQTNNFSPPYYFAITTQRVSRVIHTNSLPFSIRGMQFEGTWPVYLLTHDDEGEDILVEPQWMSIQSYLTLLGRFHSRFLDSMREKWDEVSNDSSLSRLYLRLVDETPNFWSARLLVSNVVSHSVLSFQLPVTRLYLMLPYYPAWWAMNGSYYAVDYDDAYRLRGPHLGPDAPWSEYDGFVLFSQKRPHFIQKYRWVSK